SFLFSAAWPRSLRPPRPPPPEFARLFRRWVLFWPPPTQEAAIGSGLTNRLHAPLAILGWLLLSAGADRAAAIGWDSNDFLITAGPNFPDRILVCDHDLSFKGYLDPNFLPVGGIDFDAAGHLVAEASYTGYREVRIYDS